MKWLLLILTLWAAPVWAVQPDEMLDDPVLESRARDISAGLRCPICRNESIDESNATLSRDIRIMVRELLVQGQTDQQVIDAIVSRYGEYILLMPDRTGANLILWLAAPAMLLAALGVGYLTIRGRAAAPPPDALTEAEKTRLAEIMKP